MSGTGLRVAAALCFALWLWRCPIVRAADPVRILLAIGQNVGAASDEPLRYAEQDAQRFSDVFTALGDVAPERAYVVQGATRQSVRSAISEIRGRASELRDVILVVYVSSHADGGGFHLADGQLTYAQLREWLGGVPARLRIVITDACTSGALIRTRGGKPVKAFVVDLDQGPRIEGDVYIASTGPNEPAQEWEALGGGLFTHHLLSGLRGAADRDVDGRVTLFEAYSYVYERTLAASTQARAGLQHPSHDIDLHGKGDVTLTRTASLSSGLLFANSTEGRYVVTTALAGDLVAEIDKARARSVRLALPAGRYLLRKPEGSFVRVGEFVVTPNSLATVRDEDMAQVPYAEVARRGAGLPRLWGFELGFSLSSGAVSGAGPTPLWAATWVREFGALEASFGVLGGYVGYRGQALSISQAEVWVQAEGRWRVPLGVWLPYLGISAAGGVIHQSLLRDQEAAIASTFGMGRLHDRTGTAFRLAATFGVEWSLSARFSLRLALGAGGTGAQVERGFRVLPGGAAVLAIGMR